MNETKGFEVTWEREIAGSPQEVWEAFTLHTDAYVWPIRYEPRVGGAETGLTQKGGVVTVWEPHRHFTTHADHGDGPNQLDYVLEPTEIGTRVRYVHHGTVPADDFDVQLEACQRHTELYNHTMASYVEHFSGRDANYITAEAPAASIDGSFEAVTRALGVSDEAEVGDEVHLRPVGVEPIDGVVDFRSPSMLGIRTADGFYRVYGRSRWGWPVAVGHHLFAESVDQAAVQAAWSTWIEDVFADEPGSAPQTDDSKAVA